MSDLKTLNGIVVELDYHLMWYKWMTKICPSPKDIYEFNKKTKSDQVDYLKELFNNNSEEDEMDELLSVCCGAVALYDIDDYGDYDPVGLCSDCKDNTTFKKGEDDESSNN